MVTKAVPRPIDTFAGHDGMALGANLSGDLPETGFRIARFLDEERWRGVTLAHLVAGREDAELVDYLREAGVLDGLGRTLGPLSAISSF